MWAIGRRAGPALTARHPFPMLAIAKTSDFVFRSLSTGILSDGVWQPIADNIGGGRSDALNVPVLLGLRFRRVYIGLILTAAPTAAAARLNLSFNQQGRKLAEMNFGWQVGMVGEPGVIPPFSVQEIALGTMSANQPALVGGDVPGALVVSAYSLADGVMRYVRMTPISTVQDCDEVRLSGQIYEENGTTSTCKLFCAVHSTAVAP